MGTYLVSANDLASRWAESMWPAVWQSTVLAVAVLILTRLQKNAPASLRFWVWMLVPLRLLVMPVVSVSIPILPAPMYDEVQAGPVDSGSMAPLSAKSQWDSSAQEAFVPALSEAPSFAPPEARPQAIVNWETLVLTVWGIGALAVTLRMVRGWRWVRRIVTDNDPVLEGAVAEDARKAASLMELKSVPQVVVTNGNVPPFTCGVRRPLVVLPRAFVQNARGSVLHAVLAHEFAHVRRRDSLVGFLLCVCDAIYYFHPAAHIARRRILLEREKACDALVLTASKARPSAYAKAICDAALLSRNLHPFANPPLLVAESFGDLDGRLRALACSVAPRASLSRTSALFVLLLGVLSVPGIMLTAVEPVASASAQAATGPMEPEPAQVIEPVAAHTELDNRTVLNAPDQANETRTIHFPSDRAIGVLYTGSPPNNLRYRLGPNYSAVDTWDAFAAAQGDVTVPAEAKVKLVIRGQAARRDLSPLSRIKPDALYAVEISCEEDVKPYSDNTILPHLGRLTGLSELRIDLPDLTDQGMKSLRNLTNLQVLIIGAKQVTDEGLENLAGMQSLQALSCRTTLSDAGLAHIAKLSALQELLIDVTDVRGPGLKHLAGLSDLEYVQFSGENFGDSGLEYLRHLPALKSLRLLGENLRISNAGMKHVSEIAGLEELQLIRIEGVTDEGIAYLTPLRSLRRLNLNKSITTDAALATISNFESLEELWLSNNPKSVLTDVGLSYLPKLKNLKRLNTMGWSKTPITDAGLRHLSRMSSLRELQFSGGEGITDMGISYLSNMTNLERLSILSDSHGFTDAALADIGKMTKLRSLSLHCTTNPFTVSGLNKLNSLCELRFLDVGAGQRDDEVLDWSGMTHLEDLLLDMPQTRDGDLASLGTLTSLRRLQGISGVTDEGLAKLAGLTGLQVLNVQHSSITDNGLQSLESMRRLYFLSIGGQFSGEGLEHLEGLSGLQGLVITSTTPIDDAALQRLQGKLPNLRTLRVNKPERFGASASG